MRLEIIVPGRPLPQPKPRTQGHRRFYPATYLAYRDDVRDAAQVVACELEDRGEPWDAMRRRYAVHARFWMPDRRRTDIDRLIATQLDALVRAGVLEDDRFGDERTARRGIDAARPRVEIGVVRL